MYPRLVPICLATISILCPLLSIAHGMVFKSDNVRAQWDTWAYEYEGTFYLFYEINGRIYAMFGRGGMWSYVADHVTGPYRISPKNASLITRPHTYFSRFLPTRDGLLVNHHSMSGTTLQTPSSGRQREVTYVAPFKRAEVDDEGILRWKYWEGNEALKGKPVTAGSLDFNTGIVLEADVILPVEGDDPVTLIFTAGPTNYAVRILQRGVVQMAMVASDGSNWHQQYEIDRELWGKLPACRSVASGKLEARPTSKLRILARAGMMEIYLDDHFMQCWTMGCYGEPKVKPCSSRAGVVEPAIQNMKIWQMSLEPAKAPAIQHPLKVIATASSTYNAAFAEADSPPDVQAEVRSEDSSKGVPKRRASYRPQFHFSAQEGYINDPNGLFFYNGVYHMFFQHWDMGRKAWGHATSKDLLHWTEHGDALKPHDGFQAFSGCAAVDTHNTSGLQDGQHPPIVALFTAWGDGQHLAYSTDGGWNWKHYGRVMALPSDDKKSFPLSARDPMVIWHGLTERWVMILYQNFDQSPTGKAFGFYSSPNLQDWTYESGLPGFYVCPDLFELPVDGVPNVRKWVILDWDRTECKYAIGQFDGKKFTTETGPLKLVYGAGHHGATQTWKLATDDRQRLIQIVNLWHGKFPGEPFENQMSVSLELRLRRTPQGLRLCRQPIAEVASLYRDSQGSTPFSLESGKTKSFPMTTRSFALEAELSIPGDGELQIGVLGQTLTVKQEAVTFGGFTSQLPGTEVRLLLILADVTSVEIFVNDGELVRLHLVDPPTESRPIELTASGMGSVAFKSLETHRVASTLSWRKLPACEAPPIGKLEAYPTLPITDFEANSSSATISHF